MDINNRIYATLAMRIKAFVLDALIIVVLLIALTIFVEVFIRFHFLIGIIIFFSLFLLEPIMQSIFGYSMGKYFIGIEVVCSNGYPNVPFKISIFRFFLKIISGFVSIIWFFLGLTEARQMFHDHMTETIVVISNKEISKWPNFSDDYKKYFAKASAKISLCIIVLCLVLYIITLLFSSAIAVLGLFVVIFLTIIGVVLGILSIFGLKKSEIKNVLGPAVIGIILNSSILYISCQLLYFLFNYRDI